MQRGWLALGFIILLTAQAPTDSVQLRLLNERDVAASRLIGALQSPFCPGLTLSACPSPYADDLRHEIRRRMAAGESESALRAELVQRHGQMILGEPGWQGFEIVGWIAPGVLLIVATLGLGWVLRRRLRATTRAAEQRPKIPSSTLGSVSSVERSLLEARLAEELRNERVR